MPNDRKWAQSGVGTARAALHGQQKHMQMWEKVHFWWYRHLLLSQHKSVVYQFIIKCRLCRKCPQHGECAELWGLWSFA